MRRGTRLGSKPGRLYNGNGEWNSICQIHKKVLRILIGIIMNKLLILGEYDFVILSLLFLDRYNFFRGISYMAFFGSLTGFYCFYLFTCGRDFVIFS